MALMCPVAALAQGTAAGEAEPDRGAALGMACVVVGALVLVVTLLRTIGRRNRPTEMTAMAADAPERRDLVAEAMAALDAAEATQSPLGREDEGERGPAPGKPAE